MKKVLNEFPHIVITIIVSLALTICYIFNLLDKVLTDIDNLLTTGPITFIAFLVTSLSILISLNRDTKLMQDFKKGKQHRLFIGIFLTSFISNILSLLLCVFSFDVDLIIFLSFLFFIIGIFNIILIVTYLIVIFVKIFNSSN